MPTFDDAFESTAGPRSGGGSRDRLTAAQHSPVVEFTAPHHDLTPFLSMASQLGARTLYIETSVFDPDPDEVSDPPQFLLQHVGRCVD